MKHRDSLGVMLLSLIVFALSLYQSDRLPDALYEPQYINLYFDGDPSRIFLSLFKRWEANFRTNAHPFWVWLSLPWGVALTRGLHLPEILAARLITAFWAALWAAAFQVFLRKVGLPFTLRALWLALAVSTAGVWYWVGVPETFLLAGASWLVPLLLLPGAASRLKLGTANLASFGVLVTDWVSGLLVAWRTLGWRRSIPFVLAVIGAGQIIYETQGLLAPDLESPWRQMSERQYVAHRRAATVGTRLRAYAHGVAAPEHGTVTEYLNANQLTLSVQHQALAPRHVFGWLGLGGFGGLLAVGLYAWLKAPELEPWRLPFLGTVAAQTVIHLLYGIETFLYASHYIPGLVLVSAGAAVRWPRPSAAVAAITAGCLFIHNLPQQAAALAFLPQLF